MLRGGDIVTQRNVRLISVGLFTIAALSAGSCGKKKSQPIDEQVNSQFSVSGQLAISSSALREAAGAPDKIYAIPAKTIENIYSFRKENLQTFDVGADGKFTAAVNSEQGDILLVAVDSKAANRLEGIRGVLSLKDDSGSLMRIPAKEGKQSIDMGTMNADSAGKEFVSGKKTDDVQSAFSLELSKMKELARTDDSARQLINVVANFKDNGDYFFAKPYMVFNGNMGKTKNAYTTVADSKYNGYGLYFIAKWSGVTADDFCNGASAARKLKLTPPAGNKPALCKNNACDTKEEYSVLTNLNTPGMNSEGGGRSSCSSPSFAADGQFYVYKESRPGVTDMPIGFNWGGGGYDGKMPAGVWLLEMDNVEVGRYDLKTADPIDANGNVVVYVPSVKTIVDGANKISRIEVEWNLWNAATSSYEKVTDLSSFARNVSDIGADMQFDNQCNGKSNIFEPFASTTAVPMTVDFSSLGALFPTNPNGSLGTCEPRSIAVTYALNGVQYRFDFRPYYN
ncbi:MAG: hypothetical protein RL189_1340 [Pseudomonadota bacterium]|jgi:hypothetical protein